MPTINYLNHDLPLIKINELKKGAKYIVRLPDDPPIDKLESIQNTLRSFGIEAIVIPAGVEIFEIVD